MADLWRDVRVSDSTTFPEIRRRNIETLEALAAAGLCGPEARPSFGEFVNSWLPPMWSLDLRKERVDLAELQRKRARHLAWQREQAAKREPPLTIARETVLNLGKLFSNWQEEMDNVDKTPWQSRSGNLTFLNGSFFEECAFKLPSYRELTEALLSLPKEERIDLAALAWFARGTGQSWTHLHEHATQMIGDDCRYEVGLGRDWVEGLHRWEKPPG